MISLVLQSNMFVRNIYRNAMMHYQRTMASAASKRPPRASAASKRPTREERFLFDLNGFLHIKGALSSAEVDAMNRAINDHREKMVCRDDPQLKNTKAGSAMSATGSRIDMGGMMSWDSEHGKIFRSILCHSKLVPFLDDFLGKGYRLDHSPLVLINGPNSEGFHLHGGPVTGNGKFNPELQYQSDSGGSIWTSLLGVSIALMDSEPGEGGFCLVPGSHKGKFPLPLDFRHGDSDAFQTYIHRPVTKAGDIILFSEATVHGAVPWRPKDDTKERRLALYRFAPATVSYGRAYLEDWGGGVIENCTADEAAVLVPPYARRMDRKIPGEELVPRSAVKRAHDKEIFGTEYF